MKLVFPRLIKGSGCFSGLIRYSYHYGTTVQILINRSMSGKTPSNTTHLERTETSSRHEVTSEALVTEILQLSETVKSLSFKVQDRTFSFKPGQWVDFFIPGVSTVGGFSLCSTPKLLNEHQCLKLAIKFSTHPPALWVHQKCKVGDKVLMRVGGDFYYDPWKISPVCDNLLLIAGGVGINPLYSIVQHVSDLSDQVDNDGSFTGKCTLLFSAKHKDELLFQDSLSRIAVMHPRISCKYFITSKDSITSTMNGNCMFQSKRISEKDIADVLSDFNRQKLLVFICGPPAMIQDVLVHLKNLDVPSNRIKYEKWW